MEYGWADAPLPDAANVVRYGVMESKTLRTNVEAHADEFEGEWAISVASAPDLTADEIVMAAPLRHRQVCTSTVGVIRAAGYNVVPSDDYPHADLTFPAEPSEGDFETLRTLFGETRPNPALVEGG